MAGGGVIEQAVPFFFVSTGFLLAKKMEWPYYRKQDIAQLKVYALRMLKLFIIGEVCYLPWTIYGYMISDKSIQCCILDYIWRMLFLGENYNSFVLWYLLSSVYGLEVLILLLQRNLSWKKIIRCMTFVILLSWGFDWLALADGDTLPMVLLLGKKVIGRTVVNGRMLRGFFYIPIGLLLAQRRLDWRISTGLLFGGYIMIAFSGVFILKKVGSVFAPIGLVSLVTTWRLSQTRATLWLRRLSTGIYFSHLWIWSLLCILLFGEMRYGREMYVIVVAVTVVLTSLYIILCYGNFKKDSV